ncbi:unnamed protein product [Closterium sp. Yama58-4]|nr:unnamed protein product [Closterium sp. Yama58-4]
MAVGSGRIVHESISEYDVLASSPSKTVLKFIDGDHDVASSSVSPLSMSLSLSGTFSCDSSRLSCDGAPDDTGWESPSDCGADAVFGAQYGDRLPSRRRSFAGAGTNLSIGRLSDGHLSLERACKSATVPRVSSRLLAPTQSSQAKSRSLAHRRAAEDGGSVGREPFSTSSQPRRTKAVTAAAGTERGTASAANSNERVHALICSPPRGKISVEKSAQNAAKGGQRGQGRRLSDASENLALKLAKHRQGLGVVGVGGPKSGAAGAAAAQQVPRGERMGPRGGAAAPPVSSKVPAAGRKPLVAGSAGNVAQSRVAGGEVKPQQRLLDGKGAPGGSGGGKNEKRVVGTIGVGNGGRGVSAEQRTKERNERQEAARHTELSRGTRGSGRRAAAQGAGSSCGAKGTQGSNHSKEIHSAPLTASLTASHAQHAPSSQHPPPRHDQPPLITQPAGDVRGMEQDVQYVRHAMLAAGFLSDALPPLFSPYLPINPAFFQHLEAAFLMRCCAHPPHDPALLTTSLPSLPLTIPASYNEERRQRMLLFDAVNEALGRRLVPFLPRAPWSPPPVQVAPRRRPVGMELVQEVWSEIHSWPVASTDEVYTVLDESARRDLWRGTERWRAQDVAEEEPGVVFDVEGVLLEGLLEEVCLEFVEVEQRRASKRMSVHGVVKAHIASSVMAEREQDASSPPSAVQSATDVANSPPSASESPEAGGSGLVRLVHVEIAGARKLLPKDGASSSPFCVVEFNGHTKRTQTVERDLNPVWDEKFVFAVPLPSPLTPALTDHQEPVHVTIYTLSSATAPLVAAGSISASLRRPVLGSGLTGGTAVDPERSVFLGKVQARSLQALDLNASSDPFAMVTVGKVTARTRTVPDDVNPKWNQVFAIGQSPTSFSLANPSSTLDIVIKNENRLMRDSFLGAISLPIASLPHRVPPAPPVDPRWIRLDNKAASAPASAARSTVKGEIQVAAWIGVRADEQFAEAWQSDVKGVAHHRSRTYPSPRLWYLRVHPCKLEHLSVPRVAPSLVSITISQDSHPLACCWCPSPLLWYLRVHPCKLEHLSVKCVAPNLVSSKTSHKPRLCLCHALSCALVVLLSHAMVTSRLMAYVGPIPYFPSSITPAPPTNQVVRLRVPGGMQVQTGPATHRTPSPPGESDVGGGGEGVWVWGESDEQVLVVAEPLNGYLHVQIVNVISPSWEEVVASANVLISSIPTRLTLDPLEPISIALQTTASATHAAITAAHRTPSADSLESPSKPSPAPTLASSLSTSFLSLTSTSSSSSLTPLLSLLLALEGGHHVFTQHPRFLSSSLPATRSLYPPPIARLEIGIISAKNLQRPVASSLGSAGMDVYVVVRYGGMWARTRTVCGETSPVWREQFNWPVYDLCTVVTIEPVLLQEATGLLCKQLGAFDPPLRAEVVQYMGECDEDVLSVRRLKANLQRIKMLRARFSAMAAGFNAVRSWESLPLTLAVHAAYAFALFYPSFILPTLFFLLAWQLLASSPTRPLGPPLMDLKLSQGEASEEGAEKGGEEGDDGDEEDEEQEKGGSGPVAYYKALRAKYDKLMDGAGRVQRGLGVIADAAEKIEMLLTWRDPRATFLLLSVCTALMALLLLLPFRPVALAAGFWAMRHPRLRRITPTKVKCFLARLPTRADTIY